MTSSHDRAGTPVAADGSGLADLSLAQLRSYRERLLAEEDRVSYWRRLVHARLDLSTASLEERTLDAEQVARALRATGAGSRRRVFLPIAAQEVPHDMPALRGFWDRVDGGEDPQQSLPLVEAELSAYRRAVLAALDAATAELVQRYRQAPHAALALLPDEED